MKKNKRGLSHQHKKFCLNIIKFNGNATRAYKETYPRANYATAMRESQRLLTNPMISHEIESAQEAQYKRLQASADRVIAEWTNLGFSDIGAIVWAPGELDSDGNATECGTIKPLHEMTPSIRRCIQSYTYDALGNPIIKFHAKDTSLANLGKKHGLTYDRTEHSGPGGGPIEIRWMTDEESKNDSSK